MNEEKLDSLLSSEAIKRGWADTKVQFAARILKHVLVDVHEKEVQNHFKAVIKYLEAYKFDD
jgi:hypothetical protein